MLRTKLETTQAIICACCVLYNIGIEHNNIDFVEEIPQELEEVPVVNNDILGLAFRRQFIQQHF
jgi:hypothetical protein